MARGTRSAPSAWKDAAMEELKDIELDEQPDAVDQDPELWDWARTAGISREELRAAVEQSRRGVN
jgi:hypothetical protein